MKRRRKLSEWLLERLISTIDEVIAGLIIISLGYVAGVLAGFWPSISLGWLGGVSLTLIVAVALVVALTTGGFVFWWRRHRKKVRLIQPAVTVPRDFVGREEEITWFQEMLQGKTAEKIMSIYGAPGIGKSWLANRLVKECQDAGVAWATINFREAAYDPLTLLDAVQRQLGEEHFVNFSSKLQEYIEFRAQQQREHPLLDGIKVLLQRKEDGAVSEFMRCLEQLVKEKKAVLLFDTFEKVEGTELANFLQKKLLVGVKDGGLPNLMAVVAGWNQLTWRDGWERTICPHELKYFSLEDIKQYLAIEMRVDAEAVDVELAVAVLEYTRGHPLGVGLAATLIAESVKRGEQVSKEMFPGLKSKLDERMRTELLMKRVWEQLDSDVAETAWLCAVPRWFDAGMIRVLKGIEDGSHELLDRIAKYRSFVRPHCPSGYEYQEIVRQLLLSKWQKDDPDRYIQLNQKAYTHLRQRMERVSSNERDALALDSLYHKLVVNEDEGMKLFRNWFENAQRSYRLDSCEALLEEAGNHSFCEESNRRWIKYYTGQLEFGKGRWQQAERIYLELLSEADLGLVLKSHVTSSLGEVNTYLNKWDEAIVYYNQSLEAYQTLDGEPEVGYILYGLGDAYRHQGELEKALDCCHQSLEILQKSRDEHAIARVLQILGDIHRFYGRLDSATNCYERSYHDFQEYGERHWIGWSLHGLGEVCRMQGALDRAFEYNSRSLDLFRKQDYEYGVAWNMYSIGENLRMKGYGDNASWYYQCSLEIFQKLGSREGVGEILGSMGEVYKMQNYLDKALDYYNRSADILQRLGAKYSIARVTRNMGEIYRAYGELGKALDSFDRSLRMFKKQGNEYQANLSLYQIGTVYQIQARWEEALTSYLHALEIVREQSDWYHEVRILVGLCGLNYSRGTLGEIANYAEKAEKLAKAYHLYDQLAALQCILGNVML